MTVELLQTLSLISFIAAGVFLLVGVALFFLLDVPKLYGEISGRTAKKAIEGIRNKNNEFNGKALKHSSVNSERGRLTDKITHSGSVIKKATGSGLGVGTEKLQAAPANETTVLSVESGETTVLMQQSGETTVLSQGDNSYAPQPEEKTFDYDLISNCEFSVDVELIFAVSTEIIE